MPVKDVQEWGVFRTKLDVCGQRGRDWWGIRNLNFFEDAVNEWHLTKSLFTIEYDFFSLPLHSLLFHNFFHGFAC